MVRLGVLAVLAITELVFLRSQLAIPGVPPQPGVAPTLIAAADQYISVATVGAFIVAFVATLLLALSRQWTRIATDFGRQHDYPWQYWLAGHGVAFLAFLALSWPVFGPGAGPPNPSLLWLISWLVTACAAMLLLLLSAAPAASWLRLAAAARVSVAIAAAAGIVALAGGQLAQELWKPLNELTVWCTYKLLSMIYGDVYIEPEQALLGVNDFVVEIAPACSGYEGMALILVFVSLYLWLFRTELKFPRALLLFPIGLVIIWLTNVLRIALLVAIGASASPEIALGGFHSQAGWIGFSMVALGMLSLSHRYFCAVPTGRIRAPHASDSGPAAALLMPLLALMAGSMLISALSGGFPTLYPLGVLVTAGTLWHFRGQYASLAGTVSWQSVAIGVVVFGAWLLLAPGGDGTQLRATLAAMPAWLSATWLTFRIVGSVVTVPIAEELAFRGYLLRKLVSANFESVRPGQFTWMSFSVSSVLFGLLHNSWVAGTVAGAGFALALYHRGRLSDAVVAHMTSNALIAAAVLLAGQWGLWA